MNIRIAHISDIHLSKSNFSTLKNYYLNALIKDLGKLNSQKSIDIICLTGDLLDKGGKSFNLEGNKYEYFIQEFWRPISDSLGLSDDKLFIVPGNHDVDESLIVDFTENGLAATLKNSIKINDFIKEGRFEDYFGHERQKEFKDFEKNFYKTNENRYISNFESCHITEIHGKKIGIACLNTSWRCYTKQEPDLLVMGSEQIAHAANYLKEQHSDLLIAMMHHPLDFISSIEKEEINTRLKTSGFDIVLFGHTHSGETTYTIGNNGNLFVSIARTAFSDPAIGFEKYQPGYTIIDITGLDIVYKYRKYIYARNSFDADTDMAEGGEFNTQLTPKSTQEYYYKLMHITNSVVSSKIENINESLVTFGTDSISPKNVNEIFVLPKLTDKMNDFESIDKPNYITLNEILQSEQNILILGAKETGKTTLINKLFVEVADSFSSYEKVPVKIEFHQLHNRVLRSLVKDYISPISNSELDVLLTRGDIIIFIDNVFIEDEDGKLISVKIEDFINKYPKCRIIATTSSNNGLFLEDEQSHLSGFNNIYINDIGAQEFKSLAAKWFATQNQEWIKDNLEKLIKVFEKLKISKTFFSISLFLWVIEKNTGYKPTNNHELLSIFMRYILEGFALNNTHAGSYNYSKKTEILTELAYYMLKNGDIDNSYAIKESKAIEVLQNNFDDNQLRLKPSEKLNEFISQGIIRYNSYTNTVQFRFESFFQFFIALNIASNLDFKSQILEKDIILSFIEEIDFYTGNKRTDKEVLNITIKELNEQYQDIDSSYGDGLMEEYFPKNSYTIVNLDAIKTIKQVKSLRPNNQEIEDIMDRQMSSLPVRESIRIKENKDERESFILALELASKVLKNSENIKDSVLVNNTLDLIISKAAKLSVYIQSLLVEEFKKHEGADNLNIDKGILSFFGPVFAQAIVGKWLGTEFLEVPLEKKIRNFVKGPPKSQLELFISVFLYADIQGKNYTDLLIFAVDNISNKFILELCFFKIMGYYSMKSESSSLISVFENIMARIVAKIKGYPRGAAKQIVKDAIKDFKQSSTNGSSLK